MDYNVKPAGMLKSSSFFRRCFLTQGTRSWPWPHRITELTLHSVFLPSCFLPQALPPLPQARFPHERTPPAKERGCPSAYLKPLYFLKDGLEESLNGWSVSGKSRGEEPKQPPPRFLIFCLFRLGREGHSLDTAWSLLWGSGAWLQFSLFFLSFGSHFSILRSPKKNFRDQPPITLGWTRTGKRTIQRGSWGPNIYDGHLTVLSAHMLREIRRDSAPCSTESLVPRRTSGIQTVTFTVHFLQEALCHPENEEKKFSQLSSQR